jgi:hypothetical protein
MQLPLTVSQMFPALQSADESQRSRAWQKPATLQLSAEPQLESPLQPQAPVVSSQEKPAAHCLSLEHRFAALVHAAAAARRMNASGFMGW